MRALILIAGALTLALPLGACGKHDQADNTANVDESLTAENIVSNDVTAIDAVTGDAANMAAESAINDIGAPLTNGGNLEAPTKPAAKRPSAGGAGAGAATTNAATNAALPADGNAAD